MRCHIQQDCGESDDDVRSSKKNISDLNTHLNMTFTAFQTVLCHYVGSKLIMVNFSPLCCTHRLTSAKNVPFHV